MSKNNQVYDKAFYQAVIDDLQVIYDNLEACLKWAVENDRPSKSIAYFVNRTNYYKSQINIAKSMMQACGRYRITSRVSE